MKHSVSVLSFLVVAYAQCLGASEGETPILHQTTSTRVQAQQKVRENQKGSPGMKDSDKKESPFSCNIGALNGEQRKRIIVLVDNLKAKRQEARELPDGFAFRFAMESQTLQDAAEFITYEALCCPFFDFELAVEREGGSLWLRLRGREGVKEFIKLEFGL